MSTLDDGEIPDGVSVTIVNYGKLQDDEFAEIQNEVSNLLHLEKVTGFVYDDFVLRIELAQDNSSIVYPARLHGPRPSDEIYMVDQVRTS